MIPVIGAGSTVAIYYTHADGSHSASGCWTMPEWHSAPEPTVGGDTIGESIVEKCLNDDPGENGGVFVPVVSAEIVDARRILTPWALTQDGRVYVREVFDTSTVASALPQIEVDCARVDLRAMQDEYLKGEGFRLL